MVSRRQVLIWNLGPSRMRLEEAVLAMCAASRCRAAGRGRGAGRQARRTARLARVGLVDVVVLDVLVAALLIRAWRLDRVAGLLLAPYLAWVLFATVLTAGVATMN